MKHFLISFALLVGTAVAAQAQETIKFDKTVHDFGNVPEQGGPVTYSFEFTNTGNAPLIIQDVAASCGCTTPGWSKEPVAPGGRGFVKATFAPSGAVSFDKSLTVTSTGSPNIVTLRIRGMVVAKTRTAEETFPVACGALRLRSAVLPMARIMQGRVKKDSMEFIYTGAAQPALSFKNIPPQLKLETVEAGGKHFIRCTYNTAAVKSLEWGAVKYPVAIALNGKEEGRLTVTATIVQDFSKLTAADYQTIPVATVANPAINFKELKKGATYTAEYTLTNTGKSELVIHKAESENADVKITAPANVKPGEKATVKVVLHTKNETPGDKLYAIQLITNAPNQALLSLMLTGTIK
ncbi:MAG: DUF1573 domain-containing protein [Prevotellaceae bacterium]|jgi:hypothetical protein|nr:DUF1573 domain-containing protein [Prevotellaceae bacterium]